MSRPTSRIATAAIGLMSVVLLGGCSAVATPSPVPASPSKPAPPSVSTSPTPTIAPTTSPTTSPTPTPAADARWLRVPGQNSLLDSSMAAIAGGPDRYVAVGRTWPSGGDGVGMTWTSPDGVAWYSASAPLGGGIPAGVIHDRTGYLAWGTGGAGAAVWTSPDGESWRQADLPNSGDVALSGIARLGDTLVAVGSAEVPAGDATVNEFRTWTSPDGLSWTSVDPVTSIPWNGNVYGVTASEDALVSWGDAKVGEQFVPVSLRSTDGQRWEVGTLKPGVDGFMREGISEIVGGGGRFVAVGNGLQGEAGAPPPPSGAWTSADGLAWKPGTFTSEPATGVLGRVVSNGGGYVALGTQGINPVVWRLIDGTKWTLSATAPDAGRDGEEDGCTGGRCPYTTVNDLAVGPAGLVAVGESTKDPARRSAVVWIATGD